METTESIVPYLRWFDINDDDITMVMQHVCERGWSIYTHSQAGADERLGHIGYLKLKYSNTNPKIFFRGAWHTSQALKKWTMKVSKTK